MNELIDRDEVIEIIEYVCSADDTYWKPGTLEKIRNLPTHPTPSNTLNSLDYIDRQMAIEDAREAFKRNPTMAIRVMDLIKSMPSVQPTPCEFCKHNNIADDKACLRCSAERRTDE